MKVRLSVHTLEGIPLMEPQVHDLPLGNTLAYGPVKIGIKVDDQLGEVEGQVEFLVVEP